MSIVEEALVARMQADATITAAVKTGTVWRIYPLAAPQGAAMPLITYQKISGPREHTHDRVGDLARPRFQFMAIASTYGAAKALINAVRTSLDNFRGTTSGVVIDAVQVENESDVFNLAADQNKSSYAVWIDAVVWHHE